jgi:hypothetical protein
MRILYKNLIIIAERFYAISNKKIKENNSRCNDEN